MKSRFMKFSDIMMNLVHTGEVQSGLIIKCVSTNQILILHEIMLGTTQALAFFTEDRQLVQTIDPESVWELVNIKLEGDITNEY